MFELISFSCGIETYKMRASQGNLQIPKVRYLTIIIDRHGGNKFQSLDEVNL
jgi:hypothetical protein